jgi:acyl-CoA synthetase (AMP-forming)/AMP-acid ligase II
VSPQRIVREVHTSPATIPGVLAASAAEWPHAPALVEGGAVDGSSRLTFADLAERVAIEAAALVTAGLPPGGRVALWGPNSAAWAVANLAVLAAGGTVVPVNTRAACAEATAVLDRAGATLVLAAPEFLGRRLADEARSIGAAEVFEIGAPVADADAPSRAEVARRTTALTGDSISHVQFTSGTTGRPKGVMLRHGAMVTTTRSWVSVVGLRAGDGFPVVSPCSHLAGHKTGLLSCLVTGATAIPLATFDAELLVRFVDEGSATFLQAAPTVFHDVVELVRARGRGIPALRTAVTGAAVIPPQLVRDLHDVAGIGTVLAGYGLTETTGVVTITAPGDPVDAVVTTCGRPVPGVALRLVDNAGRDVDAGARGEVWVRGPSVMVGYLDDPEATAEVLRDGWLHTGDIGELDAAGRLRIVDRLKDMVVVGGFNVFPAEVEHVLLEHPAVAQAAVVGEPDLRLGEVVVAHLVLRVTFDEPVDEPVDEAALLAFCRERLAGYKVPRRVVVRDELPRNPAGKVQKGELRELHRRELH